MTAEAKEHDERAEVYSKSSNPPAMKHPISGLTAEHVKHSAGYGRKAAEQAQELAKMHEDMPNRRRTCTASIKTGISCYFMLVFHGAYFGSLLSILGERSRPSGENPCAPHSPDGRMMKR